MIQYTTGHASLWAAPDTPWATCPLPGMPFSMHSRSAQNTLMHNAILVSILCSVVNFSLL